ncbi:hypothetical protein AA0118_g763 [Alternaria tenuissima]|nr:hypothetical protein AA0118_g763 [Alternaria tenuissima]
MTEYLLGFSRSGHFSVKLLTDKTGQGPLCGSSLISKGPIKEICG